MHFNPPYFSVGEFGARTIDMNLLPKSEAKSKITGRIENLSVHTLRKGIDTFVLFEIKGVRFRIRCEAFNSKRE